MKHAAEDVLAAEDKNKILLFTIAYGDIGDWIFHLAGRLQAIKVNSALDSCHFGSWCVFFALAASGPFGTVTGLKLSLETGASLMKKIILIAAALVAALSLGGCFGKGKAPPPVVTKG